MRLREHRAGLAESLATTIDIEPTTDALIDAINKSYASSGITINAESVHVRPYCFDERIGWNTHIVEIDNRGVFGFTDGPLQINTMLCGSADSSADHLAAKPAQAESVAAKVRRELP